MYIQSWIFLLKEISERESTILCKFEWHSFLLNSVYHVMSGQTEEELFGI